MHTSTDYTSTSSTSSVAESSAATTLSSSASSPITTSSVKHEVIESSKVLPLQDYLPLGCLHVHYANEGIQHPLATEEWVEVAGPAQLPCFNDSRTLQAALRDLLQASWIRLLCFRSSNNERHVTYRIYLLPEDIARTLVDRNRKPLRKALDELLASIDISSESWHGDFKPQLERRFDPWATPENSSLFYLFNTLPSPQPVSKHIKDRYSRLALQHLIENDQTVLGLKTLLYPYQRRSAATMLQREIAPEMLLDPRLEQRKTPGGTPFYYGPRDRIFLRNPRFYDSVRGGILSETMGTGKTLICIALILSTRGHYPAAPPQYRNSNLPIRPHVATLTDMSAATIARNSIAWPAFFDEISARSGHEMSACMRVMERQSAFYEIPPRIIRSNRSSNFFGPSEKVLLSRGTIIVVPRNLMHQWQSEIAKHSEDGSLRILVMNEPRQMLPSASELSSYDIVLFSKPRFEAEDNKSDRLYESPLKHLHWLRIIIDEGHYFSASSTRAVRVAEQVVRAERRWVVSGTPAKDLLGVEVDLPAMSVDDETSKAYRRQSLEQRRLYSRKDDSAGAINNLGALATQFLQAQPWAKSHLDAMETSAVWDEYIWRHEDIRLRTYTSFSKCLRETLQHLVVKTQPDDVERDLKLPPITHTTVRLDPSFYDKITANLFALFLNANAITSERVDRDYLFHKANQPRLHKLISNLRQSGFMWRFDEGSVFDTVETAEKYLSKEDMCCTYEDSVLLMAAVASAKVALSSCVWQDLSRTKEIGLFMTDWPQGTSDFWAFENCGQDPVVMGLTQAVEAQKYVNNHLSSPNPIDGLAGAGISAKLAAQASLDAEDQIKHRKSRKEKPAKTTNLNAGPSDTSGDIMGLKRLSAFGTSTKTSPSKSPKKLILEELPPSLQENLVVPTPQDDPVMAVKSSRKCKRRLSGGDVNVELSADIELGRTMLTGTTSSKFTYLIERVLLLQKEEKILIFYQGDHVAFYLSQAFDLFNVKHLIYSNTLSGDQKSKYIVLFDTDPNHRVLLMDIKQAAHGLNLSSASRVFFVNPVCRPGIEAQAMKRAHRIGQTKPVHVETLVLKGTIEEAMHDRARNMTQSEHLAAKELENDSTIAEIIQGARILPLHEGEAGESLRMAALKTPQQLFGRPGRGGKKMTGLEVELFGDTREGKEGVKPVKKRKKLLEEKNVTASTINELQQETNQASQPGSVDISQQYFPTTGLLYSSNNSIFGGS